ncbi:MAG: transcriptional coactivator PipX [Thermosynechococcaceae cyanobacterium]
MINETYLSHPTFGLLFSICLIEPHQKLYTTLYAQRLFFIVSSENPELEFNAINRNEARIIVEGRLRVLRRSGTQAEYEQLQTIYHQTFQ